MCIRDRGIAVGDLERDETVVHIDNVTGSAHLHNVLVVDVDGVLVSYLLVLLIDGEFKDVTDLEDNLGGPTLSA